jgi:hypothetical protein
VRGGSRAKQGPVFFKFEQFLFFFFFEDVAWREAWANEQFDTRRLLPSLSPSCYFTTPDEYQLRRRTTLVSDQPPRRRLHKSAVGINLSARKHP